VNDDETFDPEAVAKYLEWMQNNPQFEEKPASIAQFLGTGYLGIEKGIRPGVRQELMDIFGEEVNTDRIALYQEAIFTGGIGIGKTTLASIVIPYMLHWTLCLENPQEFYDLLPGSRIAFMQMSTSESQALEVIFGDLKARIDYCKWFQEKYPYDPKYTKQLRFEKDIWVLPGNSAETTFEGYNILGGILDEADSHKITVDKDYADDGYNTILSRIDSRYQDRGFALIIGQMKSSTGFAARKYEEFQTKPTAHTLRMTIWDSLGWEKFSNPDGTRDSFWYDRKRKEIVPSQLAQDIADESANLIEIPNVYKHNFINNPEKALRDLAGIPPAAGDPFISLTYKIDEAVERWNERYDNLGSPVDDKVARPGFADWFFCKDPLPRVAHIDIAYSPEGDAAGIAVGHVAEIIEIDGEMKPYIVFDCLYRVHASPGTEIMIADLRHVIYDLRDYRKFRIRRVTMDGFEGQETKQQLRKRRFQAEKLSVDKNRIPYEDLRDALYEDRVEFPPYITYIRAGQLNRVSIAVKELTELEDDIKKIDHPPQGSKDVADCMAGVTFTLMGDRSYRRKVSSLDLARARKQELESTGTDGYQIGDIFIPGTGSGGLQAPVPPTGLSPGEDGFIHPVPPSLIPKRKGR
jgi:hypothetical protein